MASVSPRIVLHIGAPKTASTYLQRRLRANAAALREHGIYVPVIPAVAAMAGNAKLLATALSQRPSLTFQRGLGWGASGREPQDSDRPVEPPTRG